MGDLIAGRYELLSVLGTGGMGQVWAAHDTLLDRRVALKRLHTRHPLGTGGEDSDGTTRMLREARIAAGLSHPNIVAIHDLQMVDGEPLVVMELVPGQSLAEAIAEAAAHGTTLPPHRVAAIGAGIAEALAAAHAAGILHRDVKPANVLLDRQGRARLGDFGIARAQSDTRLTGTGLMIGTIAYLAPEIALGEGASPASDGYALGATLYAACEGRAPHAKADGDDEATAAMLLRMVSAPVPPPVRSGALGPLLMRLLDSDPTRRPTSADAARELAAWAAAPAEQVDAAPPPQPADAPEPVGAPQPTVARAPARLAADEPATLLRATPTQAPGAPAATDPHAGTDLDGANATGTPRRRWLALAAAALLVAAGGGTYLATRDRTPAGALTTTIVPAPSTTPATSSAAAANSETATSASTTGAAASGFDPCLIGTWRTTEYEQRAPGPAGEMVVRDLVRTVTFDARGNERVTYDNAKATMTTGGIASELLFQGTVDYVARTAKGTMTFTLGAVDGTYSVIAPGGLKTTFDLRPGTDPVQYTCSGDTYTETSTGFREVARRVK